MLMTKRRQFSCQIILQGALEEIIKQTLLFNFCFPALFPLISRVRVSGLQMRTGSRIQVNEHNMSLTENLTSCN